MRPERIVIGLALALVAAGFIAWAVGGASVFRDVSVWLWLGAFGVLCLPLLLCWRIGCGEPSATSRRARSQPGETARRWRGPGR